MFKQLYIQNIGLIEESEIAFSPGLNIFTGETGAGKSMVIDAVNFVLGERAGKGLLRQGTDKARVEALFVVTGAEEREALARQEIELEADGELWVSRSLSGTGKTVNRLNGEPVAVSSLKEVGQGLLDIHGQHEHQSLLHPARQLALLDRFCGEELAAPKRELAALLDAFRQTRAALSAIPGADGHKEELLDFLRFQWNELSAAQLRVGEEEELLARQKRLSNSEKIRNFAGKAAYQLDGDQGALDKLGEALGFLNKLSALDEQAAPLEEAVNNAYAAVEDAAAELKEYFRDLETDPAALDQVETRLDALYRIKRKYGGSVEAAMEKMAALEQEMEALEGGEARRQELTAYLAELETQIWAVCRTMHRIRQEQAERIQSQIEAELREMAMPSARFGIQLTEAREFGPQGATQAEFLFSANRGQEVQPLKRIASGGEMSRVMLAIKVVLGALDSIETFIFDEIDTGISGRAAQRVGEKLAQLGQERQILCVTHLPQIAARATAHFRIEKTEDESGTHTGVTRLDEEGAVAEIARLMGGDNLSAATLQAARELKHPEKSKNS